MAARFGRARGGNVAIMWGLMGAVLVGLVGLTVDFTRAQTIRAQMQNAADGAALVAERLSNLTLAEREAAAQAFFDAEMGSYAGSIDFEVVEMDSGGHEARATYVMPLGLAHLVRNEDWTINVVSEAQAQASPPIEVVMALDNTGSMRWDMDTLRDGAEDLAEFLLSLDGDTVSVGIVPFVAQVNIGSNAPTSWLDTTAENPHHGEFFEDRYMGRRNTYQNACTNSSRFPTSYGGFTVRWIKGSAATPGYTDSGKCYAFAPSAVNIFDLYENLPEDAAWKGCVEARPEPYDISDDAPSAGTPATLFVPFMSPDEGNDDTDSNNWITNTTYDRTGVFGLSGWTAGDYVRTTAVYKYRSGVPVSINTSNTSSGRGPNRGCPTPITPLSSDSETVIAAIQAMDYWYGGGTNQIEGLSWAWRVISPGEPYTQGRPYNDPEDPVRKVIVLFTDGDNTSLSSDNNAFESEYAGLGLRSVWSTYQYETQPSAGSPGLEAQWRRTTADGDPLNSGGRMETYMNTRQALLCTAIKNAGIEIYTIGFNITDGSAVDTLLEGCATQDGEHYYFADNQSELLEAFTAIGSGIGQLRITR